LSSWLSLPQKNPLWYVRLVTNTTAFGALLPRGINSGDVHYAIE